MVLFLLDNFFFLDSNRCLVRSFVKFVKRLNFNVIVFIKNLDFCLNMVFILIMWF